MHERTQRAIARLMFVFCCAIPTTFTLLCILVTWTPWYHHRAIRGIEATLSQATGLTVEIEDFQRASPSNLRLDGVRLTDSETKKEVARVRQIDWVRRGEETSMLLQQPELQSSGLARTWSLVHDRFLCQPKLTTVPFRLAANDLTIHSRSGAMTLRDVDAWIESQEQTVEASIQCLPAIAGNQTPIQISIRRDRGEQVATTQWSLDTNSTPLPCSLLADYFPKLLSNLGRDAMFAGAMNWEVDSENWWIDLSGSRFENISLDRVFEQQAHRLSGTGSLQFERCRIEPGRRIDIVGSFHGRNGLVGRSLMHSLQHNLGFQVQLPDGDEDVPYDRIAMQLNLNDTQLRLDGICRHENGFEGLPVGIAMHVGGYPLVQSSAKTFPAIRLMAALAPSHSVMVPLANQNSSLMSLLIPPSRAMPTEIEYRQPRIRTARDWNGGPLVGEPH